MRNVSNHEDAWLAHQCTFDENIARVSIYLSFEWLKLFPKYICWLVQLKLIKTAVCRHLIILTLWKYCRLYDKIISWKPQIHSQPLYNPELDFRDVDTCLIRKWVIEWETYFQRILIIWGRISTVWTLMTLFSHVHQNLNPLYSDQQLERMALWYQVIILAGHVGLPNETDTTVLAIQSERQLLKNDGNTEFGVMYELLDLTAFKISMLYKNHIFQYMGKVLCVELQRIPLKFHPKYLSHTLKDVDFIHMWKFKSSWI